MNRRPVARRGRVGCWALLGILTLLAPLPVAGGDLAAWVVRDYGREMPLATCADLVLRQFSGRPHLGGEDSLHFLGRLLFDPVSTQDDPLFLLRHRGTRAALGLPLAGPRRVSYARLSGCLTRLDRGVAVARKTARRDRSPVEAELLRLAGSIARYTRLASTLRAFFPHQDFVIRSPELRRRLGLSPAAIRFSFHELASKRARLRELTAPLPGRPAGRWSEEEWQAVRLLERIEEWRRESPPGGLAMLPVVDARGQRTWLSPWEALRREGRQSAELALLAGMARDYHPATSAAFDRQTELLRSEVMRRVADPGLERRIRWELRYRRSSLPLLATLAGCVALLLALLSSLTGWHWPRWAARGALGGEVLLLAAAFTLRLLITGRPPVTNRYETFLFVALAAALLGTVLEGRSARPFGVWLGGGASLASLLVAGAIAAGGDTLGPLVSAFMAPGG